MLSFSVMKSTFCLAYIEFIAIPAASFVDNSRHLLAFICLVFLFFSFLFLANS